MPRLDSYTDVDAIDTADKGVLSDASATNATKQWSFTQLLTFVASNVSLAASAITSGVLAAARGGLGTDASAASGLTKFTAGSASFVTAPSGTIVGDSDTQTLTNKTISGASNTLSNLAASVITSGQIGTARGGTGQDFSSSTGLVKVASGTASAATLVNADVSASAAIAVNKLETADAADKVLCRVGAANAFQFIVNANVASGASIAYSKLNLAGSIVNADVASGAAIAYSKLNLATSIVNADVNASAAIAGTKISPDFGSQDVVTTGFSRATSFRVGTGTVSTVGGMRVDTNAQTILGGRNAANTADLDYISINATNKLYVGTDPSLTSSKQASSLQLFSSTDMGLGIGTSNYVYLFSGKIETWKPVAGSSTGSLPFRWKRAAITQSSTSDTTLTAAQYECPILTVSGTPGGDFNLIAPNSDGAFFIVRNTTANTLTIKKSGGTGVTVATNASRVVFHDGTDYVYGNG